MLPSVIISVFMGFFYEILRFRKVLVFAFVLIPIGVILLWLDGEWFTIAARIIIAIACQTILQNPLLNDYVKSNSRGKGAAIEKFGYVLGAFLALVLFVANIEFIIVAAMALILGLACTFWTKQRRVSRDYVEYAAEVKRVKEKLRNSDDEEDSDCEVNRSNMGEYVEAHTVRRSMSLRKKLSLLLSQIKLLLFHDWMYAFLLLGHLVSKMIDQSLLFTYMCWFGSFGIESEDDPEVFSQAFSSKACTTMMVGMFGSCLLMLIFGTLSDKVGFEF